MIDKETEVKRLLNEFDSKYNVSISETEKNINDIARRIVKLFPMHLVNDSVCTSKHWCPKQNDDDKCTADYDCTYKVQNER